MSRLELFIKSIEPNMHIPSYAKRFENVVEVVRCKDCKWYERKFPWNRHSYECSYLEAPMDDNDYCSLGERREDAKTG